MRLLRLFRWERGVFLSPETDDFSPGYEVRMAKSTELRDALGFWWSLLGAGGHGEMPISNSHRF